MRVGFRFRATLRRFLRNENGAALWLTLLFLPVVIGVIGLVFDGSRLFTLNSEQQDLADAAALAGARELDGTQDGMDAAVDAALNLLDNDPRWSDVAAAGVQIVQPIRFCGPNLGPDAATACDPTDDPREATYIEIVTIQRNVTPTFIRAVGGTGQAASQAVAIAGATTVACNVQPLMLCNPMEATGQEFSAEPGQMFWFKAKESGGGSNPAYAPGNFGLLDPPGQDSSTGPQLRQLLSQQSPNFCYINLVSPRPGHNTGSFDMGINVRFDLQPNGQGQLQGLDLTPAPNVIKGTRPNNPNNQNQACNPNQQQDLGPAGRLPRDTGFTQVNNSVRVGGERPSQAAKDAYWQLHHGATWPADVTTRYDAYLRELEMMANNAWGIDPKPENPAPRCVPNGWAAGDARRRVLSVAIVDCLQENVRGNSTTNVRSHKYAEFFITEPAAGGELWTEFIRMMTPDQDDSRLRRIVQLYR